MPVFVGAGTSAFMKGDGGIGFPSLSTSAINALSGMVEGQVAYDTTINVLKYYDGSSWKKVSAEPCVLNSVTGTIFDGLASSITLSGTGFLTANLVIRFVQSADSIDVSVTVTPSSDTAATTAVPATVYNAVTAGRTVTITAQNSDGSTSAGVSKTAAALPSGGNINTYSGYRSHKFTSSGTWVNTGITSVDLLLVAGGGGGGSDNAGGGGAGGMLVQTNVPVSAQNYSITVGGGGNGSVVSHGDGGPYAQSGGNSTALGYTANGGGNGSSSGSDNASPGGSGGGGGNEAASTTGGTGTSGQGNNGGNGANGGGGGGGGKGGAGQNGNVRGSQLGGNGGAHGTNNYETGSNQNYAAGGGGANENGNFNANPSSGGIGGVSPASPGSRAPSGTDGTGSGGGGSTHTTNTSPTAGDGGDGVVVIRYAV